MGGGPAVGLDPPAEGVEQWPPFGQDGNALDGLVVEGVEVVEELAEESLAGYGRVDDQVEVGGEVADIAQGVKVKGDVDADAEDGVGYLVSLDGGFDENAGDLLAMEHDIVGPLDTGICAGASPNGTDYGDAGKDANHGEGRQGRPEENGKVEVAGAGDPAAAKAAAASGLDLGHDDKALVCAGLGLAGGFVHGGGNLLEEEDALADDAGEEAAAEGCGD